MKRRTLLTGSLAGLVLTATGTLAYGQRMPVVELYQDPG